MFESNRWKITLLLGVLIVCAPGWSLDFRTTALANTDLVLRHRENGLDLFHTAGNPAWLKGAEPDERIQLHLGSDVASGSLRRPFDPRYRKNFQFHVEGVKITDERQTFRGEADYGVRRLYDLRYAIEPYPYDDDPLILADTTVGTFHYSGPRVTVQYQYQLSRNLGLGAGMTYAVSQGVKKQYSRARILQRDFSVKVGSALKINEHLVLGGVFQYRNNQDQIELQQNPIDNQTIVFRKYYSENFYLTLATRDLRQYNTYHTYHTNLSLQLSNKKRTVFHLLKWDYRYRKMDAFAETSRKEPDSGWFSDSYDIMYEGRYQPPDGGWSLGIRAGYRYLSGFSRHPRLAVTLTRRKISNVFVELGVSRRLRMLRPVLITLQGGFRRTHDRYDDYQSRVFRDLSQKHVLLKTGLEFNIHGSHRLLFGYQYGRVDVDTFSPRYLPDHLLHRLSAGLSFFRDRNELALLLIYAEKQAFHSQYTFSSWQMEIFWNIAP